MLETPIGVIAAVMFCNWVLKSFVNVSVPDSVTMRSSTSLALGFDASCLSFPNTIVPDVLDPPVPGLDPVVAVKKKLEK